MNTLRDPDAVLGAWLDDGPQTLPDETRQAIAVGIRTVTRRHSRFGWPFARLGLPTIDVRRLSIALGSATVVVVAAAVALNLYRSQVGVGGPPPLPTTPASWSRVVIDTGVEGSVQSLAATPRGLLAGVEDEDGSRWYFSVDGRTWTEVPADQIPPLDNPSYSTGAVSVAGNDQRILIAGRLVLASEDGINWSRIASPSEDPDLGQGAINALAAAGPGFVAVGIENKAWYSTDGTDWTPGQVPPRPEQPPVLRRPLDPDETQGGVEMEGIAQSGNNLLTWGKSIWVHDDGSATFVPVLWTSPDGLSWTNQSPPDPTWDYPTVTGGPNGFLIAGEDGPIWLSADGKSWERVAGNPFEASGSANEMFMNSIAAGRSGFVAAGGQRGAQYGECFLGCPSEEAVIWTSPDGRSWTRLLSDDLFRAPTGAGAGVAVAWGPNFIVGGESDGQPAIWISDSRPPRGGGADVAP